MHRALYEHFGDMGMGEANPKPRPVIGSPYVAGGFVVPAMLGAEIEFAPSAAPQPKPVSMSIEQIEKMEKPNFRELWPMQ